ncbi:SulP family inorganic anion transporter, partial [Pseudomonas sp. BGM005]|nr:SulP family inorganic anion transporter [Pseudomonas sp. BG5]
AGVFQVILGVLGVAKLMRFIPRSVMVGFVNALAIFVFSSQFPQLIDVPWLVYPLVALGIVVMIVMPKITKIVPAPLVSVIIVTAVVLTMGLTVPTVGDQGELPQSLPSLFLPDIPWTWET